jgi:hypothetical protein
MAVAITKNHAINRRASFVLAATTANQVALSIDLSGYGGSAGLDARFALKVLVTPGFFSPSTDALDYYFISGKRSGASAWSSTITATSMKGAASGLVDFNFSTNTLQVRVDGAAAQSTVAVEVTGLVIESSTS